MVRRLRRRWRVLYLGSGRQRTRNDTLSTRTSIKEGVSKSLFHHVQLTRALVAHYPGAVLVLMGGTDAILFGDLAGNRASVTVADPTWPGRFPIETVRGAESGSTERACLAALLYALRSTEEDELHTINRNTSTDFALLENRALERASVACYRGFSQLSSLVKLRGTELNVRPFCPWSSVVRGIKKCADTVLLIGDLPASDQNASNVLGVIFNSVTSLTGVVHVALMSHGRVYRLQAIPNGLESRPWSDVEVLRRSALSVALADYMVDPIDLFRAMSRGIPVLAHSSEPDHGLHRLLPKEHFLDALDAQALARTLGSLPDGRTWKATGDSAQSVIGGNGFADLIAQLVAESAKDPWSKQPAQGD